MSRVLEGCLLETVGDSRRGPCSKQSCTPLRRNFGSMGRSSGRMAMSRGGRRMGATMVRWAESGFGSAAAEKAYSRPPSTACKHSANTTRAAATHKWICNLSKKSQYMQYRCCRGLVTPSRAATVGTSKEIVDHGRGMSAASLLAVVCCSTKC